MTRNELLRLIGATYDATLEPARWSALMGQICDTFGADAAVLSRAWKFETPLESWSARFDPDCLAARFAGFGTPAVNAGMKACATMSVGQVVPRRRMLDDNAFTREAAARTILLPQRLFYSCMSTLERQGGVLGTLGVFRTTRAGDFDKSEIERLEAFTSHFVRVLAFRRQMKDAEALQRQTEQALDRLDVGILLLDDLGRIIFANAAARKILDDHPGIAIRHDRLVAERSYDAGQLAALLAAAAQSGERPGTGGAICVARGAERSPVQLWVMPLSRDVGLVTRGKPQATNCAMLVDPELTPRAPAAVLRSLWGLTGAEARLAQALLTGDRLEDHAASAAISMNTARTHLKVVFAKTGTARQAELVRVLAHVLLPKDDK